MPAEVIALILGMAGITFLTRFLFIAVLGRVRISEKTITLMQFVPIAVLTSLIIPALLAPQGRVDVSFKNEYLMAGIFATAVTCRTKSLVLAIVIGIATILSMRLLIA
jgi:branched-subunit amino acid transport protein